MIDTRNSIYHNFKFLEVYDMKKCKVISLEHYRNNRPVKMKIKKLINKIKKLIIK